MWVEEFLEKLECVKARSKSRWSARCPAHQDKTPSLSIKETHDGTILIHCFAGCPVEAISAACGITVADLFTGNTHRSAERQTVSINRAQKFFDWERTAAQLQDHALGLYLRAESILTKARGIDASMWTDAERAMALNAVTQAYEDLERADLLEDVAFGIRYRHLPHNHEHHGPTR